MKLSTGKTAIKVPFDNGDVGVVYINTTDRTIQERINAFEGKVEEKIRNMENITVYGAEQKTAITAFNIAGRDCVEVSQRLNDDYSIAIRAGLHCAVLAHESLGTRETGCVRASFGYFNTTKEIDYAADAIYKLSKDLQNCQN